MRRREIKRKRFGGWGGKGGIGSKKPGSQGSRGTLVVYKGFIVGGGKEREKGAEKKKYPQKAGIS